MKFDAATERMLASFRKVRADRMARGEVIEVSERTQSEIDAEALKLFDADEAREINRRKS